MLLVLGILILAFQSFITFLTATPGSLVEPTKRGLEYFTMKGIAVIVASILAIVLTFVVLWFTALEQKEASDILDKKLRDRDSIHQVKITKLADDFARMTNNYSFRTDSLSKKILGTTDSNYSNYINILAQYKLGMDSSNTTIQKLVKDSAGQVPQMPFLTIQLPRYSGDPRNGVGVDSLKGNRIHFHFSYINVGNSPAYQIHFYHTSVLMLKNGQFSFDLFRDRTIHSHNLIPGATSTPRTSVGVDAYVKGIFFYLQWKYQNSSDRKFYNEYMCYYDLDTKAVSQLTLAGGNDIKNFLRSIGMLQVTSD